MIQDLRCVGTKADYEDKTVNEVDEKNRFISK
jgi:hypothetical protein